MKEMKLIPMVQFVLEHPASHDYEWQLKNHLNYANFLSQPLALWMFVPVGDNGEVLEEPYFDGENDMYYGAAKDAYNKAKSRCLFEGFEVVKTGIKTPWQTHNKGCPIDQFVSAYRMGSETVESMLSSVEPFLTQTAITQIFG